MDERAMLDLVRRFWEEVVGDGRTELIDTLLTDPYRRHSASGNAVRSHAEVKQDVTQYRRVLRDASVRILESAVVGDRVWTILTAKGMNLDTEELNTVSLIQCHRLEADRIAEVWILSAAGVDWGA